MDDITHWLSSYEAELGARDPAWDEASRRIWVMLSDIENGYATKSTIHRGLEAIARDCGKT